MSYRVGNATWLSHEIGSPGWRRAHLGQADKLMAYLANLDPGDPNPPGTAVLAAMAATAHAHYAAANVRYRPDAERHDRPAVGRTFADVDGQKA